MRNCHAYRLFMLHELASAITYRDGVQSMVAIRMSYLLGGVVIVVSWSFHFLMLSNFVLISGWILEMFWFYLSSMAYCYICLHVCYEPSIHLTFWHFRCICGCRILLCQFLCMSFFLLVFCLCLVVQYITVSLHKSLYGLCRWGRNYPCFVDVGYAAMVAF